MLDVPFAAAAFRALMSKKLAISNSRCLIYVWGSEKDDKFVALAAILARHRVAKSVAAGAPPSW